MAEFLIVGCGFTGRRVAATLLGQGHSVAATTRRPAEPPQGVRAIEWDAAAPDAADRLHDQAPPGAAVLWSLPTLRTDDGLDEPAPRLTPALAGIVSRVVYLSTTGVYGPAHHVDAQSEINPTTQRQRLRAAAEAAVHQGPWSSLVLRPAAIYGPGRGVQVAIPTGRYKLVGTGDTYTSRIHVDDLAAISSAALQTDLTGAWPVADDEPSTSRAIAEFVCQQLGIPLPETVTPDQVDETRRADRRVDGSAVRERLGVELRYPSYRVGIPASLAEAKEGPV